MNNNTLENDNKNTKDSSVSSRNIYQRLYYSQNKDKFKAYQKKYYLKNKEKFKIYLRRYHLKNKDKFNAYQRNYVKQRRKIDPEYRAKLSELSRTRYLDYEYSKDHRKYRRISMNGYTMLNPTIKSRRKRATDRLDSLPSNIVTIKDMIKYYIYSDKNEK